MELDINATSLETFIYNSLKGQIINLDLLPGTKLSEIKVAKMFNCSRTPVRNAFYKLRVKGYVDSRPQVGTFVSKIDLTRVKEVSFIRESVEIAVLRLGIEKGFLLSKVPLLQANMAEMKQARLQSNLKRFTELDMMFHNILYIACGKSFVRNYVGDDDVHYSRLRFMVTRDSTNLKSTIDEHQKMVDMIKAGTTKDVNQLVTTHLNNIFNYLNNTNAEVSEKFFCEHI